jgi:hypothetical protein
VPIFARLYVRKLRPGEVFSVGLVNDHGPLLLLSATMEDAGARTAHSS